MSEPILQKPKSILFYFLPAFLAVIGGIIAFIILKKSDPKKARNSVVIGLVSSEIEIAFDLIVDAFDLPVGDYIARHGIVDYIGGASIYVMPPIIVGYYIVVKIKIRKNKTS